jgi:hypothetical protein
MTANWLKLQTALEQDFLERKEDICRVIAWLVAHSLDAPERREHLARQAMGLNEVSP